LDELLDRHKKGPTLLHNTHMNKAKVSIVKARDYDCAQIYAAVEKGVKLIGGLEKVVRPRNKVFVKVNHLPPASLAERGIVTHPIFVEAVLELLKRTDADVTVGDDIESDTEDGFQVSGFREMCKRAGVRLVNLREAGFTEAKCNGHFLKEVYLSTIALDADVIINLPKLKTHSLTIFTGGVKNMYGTIPNGLRTRFHGEHMRNEDFSQVLTDIFSAVTPQLTIMDGIIAMEGEGPASGGLRKLGIILASQDTIALDAVATNIIGLDSMDIYTTRYSDERGLGVGNFQNIEVVGERIEDVRVPDFRLPAGTTNLLARRVPQFVSRPLLGQLSVRPRVIEHQCTGCLECVRICPVSAISISGKTAKINHSICIQCMCCHEVCRFNAIIPKRPLAGSVVHSLASILRRRLLSLAFGCIFLFPLPPLSTL